MGRTEESTSSDFDGFAESAEGEMDEAELERGDAGAGADRTPTVTNQRGLPRAGSPWR